MTDPFDRKRIPEWVRNEQKYRSDCRRLKALAQRVATGKESVIEATVKMRQYQFWLREKENQEFEIFSIVESATNHLPRGSAREYWDESVLRQKDVEIKRIEDLYRERVVEAAAAIFARYSAIVEGLNATEDPNQSRDEAN